MTPLARILATLILLAPAGASAEESLEAAAGDDIGLHANVSLAASFNDRLTAHVGGLLQVSYTIVDTFEIALVLGLLDGRANDTLVDVAEGMPGNRAGRFFWERELDIPGLRQVSGIASAVAIWRPFHLYPTDSTLHFDGFLVAGGGVNGTRRYHINTMSLDLDISTKGGAFQFLEPHIAWGGGIVTTFEIFTAKLEMRALSSFGEFLEETHVEHTWLFLAGLGIAL